MTCTWIESGGSSCSHRPQSGVKTARFPPDHLDACCSPRPSSPRCMTASTDWPRIGPAVYCATTQEDELRREENPQVDKHLKASPQVAESAPGTLSRWRHGFEPRWDYLTLRCANQRRKLVRREDLLPAHHAELLDQEPDERLPLLRRGAPDEHLEVLSPIGHVVGRWSR